MVAIEIRLQFAFTLIYQFYFSSRAAAYTMWGRPTVDLQKTRKISDELLKRFNYLI